MIATAIGATTTFYTAAAIDIGTIVDDGNRVLGAGVFAVMGPAVTAGIGYHIAVYGTTVTGDCHHLDGTRDF
jgi:hypothetical protein